MTTWRNDKDGILRRVETVSEPSPVALMRPLVDRQVYLRRWRLKNRDRVNRANRAWEKRNPEKLRQKQARWRAKHRDHLRAYLKRWHQEHGAAVFASKLKALKPDESLFKVFVSLDSYPGYEGNFLVNQETPLTLLMEREAA